MSAAVAEVEVAVIVVVMMMLAILLRLNFHVRLTITTLSLFPSLDIPLPPPFSKWLQQNKWYIFEVGFDSQHMTGQKKRNEKRILCCTV